MSKNFMSDRWSDTDLARQIHRVHSPSDRLFRLSAIRLDRSAKSGLVSS